MDFARNDRRDFDDTEPFDARDERESGVRDRPTLPMPGGHESYDDVDLLSRRLGAYRLLEPLGSGSMGRVYRAQHVVLGRPVAIKMLRPELASDSACVERFIAEARAVNLLNHPHVIQVTDIANGPRGMPWFVMEMLEGADLAAIMRRETLSLPRALEIMRQVCEALDAIHAVGIVHRDVKPENIFVTQREGRDFIKLIDFGVARLHDPRNAEPICTEGLVGTPQYMAPEQSCAGELDHRSDLYAIGSVLFELITGETPFRREELSAMLNDLLFAPPPRPSAQITLPVSVRAELDTLVLRCLAKRPTERPSSAREIAGKLGQISALLRTTKAHDSFHVFALPHREPRTPRARAARHARGEATRSRLLGPALAWGLAAAAALVPASIARDATPIVTPAAEQPDASHAMVAPGSPELELEPVPEPEPVAIEEATASTSPAAAAPAAMISVAPAAAPDTALDSAGTEVEARDDEAPARRPHARRRDASRRIEPAGISANPLIIRPAPAPAEPMASPFAPQLPTPPPPVTAVSPLPRPAPIRTLDRDAVLNPFRQEP